ncbi:hypothetical protein DW231_00565 [Bifidobacterium pseudocatenulatum]|nr:hypothetical protein DW231_00565 [Bifidobacterium pseudocatenulatum]
MLHVSLQIAFGSAGEFATIRPSMVFDVVVGVLVERKLQCFALAFSCLWRVPFHDSTPVEVYEQLLFLEPFFGTHSTVWTERFLAAYSFVCISGYPCLYGAVIAFPCENGPELSSFH